mmetsp:Transcript_4359/g.9786  ORF Transcript_4359/g.9786 Transcript_4359/m.9786 type:complete len:216 (-) Transcript_4359:821-1468(-)
MWPKDSRTAPDCSLIPFSSISLVRLKSCASPLCPLSSSASTFCFSASNRPLASFSFLITSALATASLALPSSSFARIFSIIISLSSFTLAAASAFFCSTTASGTALTDTDKDLLSWLNRSVNMPLLNNSASVCRCRSGTSPFSSISGTSSAEKKFSSCTSSSSIASKSDPLTLASRLEERGGSRRGLRGERERGERGERIGLARGLRDSPREREE